MAVVMFIVQNFSTISRMRKYVLCARGPFYLHGLTLISTWISNHIYHKVEDEITYSFSNFNGATLEVWEWKYF